MWWTGSQVCVVDGEGCKARERLEIFSLARVSGGGEEDPAIEIAFELPLPSGVVGLVEIVTGDYATDADYREVDGDAEVFQAEAVRGRVQRPEPWCSCRDLRFELLFEAGGADAELGTGDDARRALYHGLVVRDDAPCLQAQALPPATELEGAILPCADDPPAPPPPESVGWDMTLRSYPRDSGPKWPHPSYTGGRAGGSSGPSGGCSGDAGGGCGGGGSGGGDCRYGRASRRAGPVRTLPAVLALLLVLHCGSRRKR